MCKQSYIPDVSANYLNPEVDTFFQNVMYLQKNEAVTKKHQKFLVTLIKKHLEISKNNLNNIIVNLHLPEFTGTFFCEQGCWRLYKL